MTKTKSGVDKLRDIREFVVGTTISDKGEVIKETVAISAHRGYLHEIADQIEREHAAELANAQRDLTDEAREVVKRLRDIDCSVSWDVSDRGGEFLRRISHAMGLTGFTWRMVRDRLIELIEHGTKQDVDVAALLELADELKSRKAYAQYSPVNANNIGIVIGIGDSPERICKAVEDAPKPNAYAMIAEDMGMDEGSIRACLAWYKTNQSNIDVAVARDAAADWVEQQGGLEEIKHHYSFMVDQVAKRVGVVPGADELEHVTIDKIMSELDKRLIPLGMAWPRYDDGDKVLPSDEGIIGIEYSLTGNTVLVTTSDNKPRVAFAPGERVKRPEPEVLGSDGKPIKVGDVVNHDYTTHTVAKVHASASPRGDTCPWVRYTNGRWDFASDITHGALETQERIDEDKRKAYDTYWGCDTNISCLECPALIDGMRPCKYYGVSDCHVAQGMDIARRERELDAKTAGGTA